MKMRLNKILVRCATLVASLAMVTAVSSATSTCVIFAYQPDLPKELQ